MSIRGLSDYIQSENCLKNSRSISFYGGSFNPWHKGHQSCVKLGCQKSPVVIIPDHNPKKPLRLGDERFTDLSEIKTSISGIRNAKIYSRFYEEERRNPTHQWFGEIRKNFPEKRLGLVLGFDSFLGINSWSNSEKLLKDLDFLHVVSRGESIAQAAFQTQAIKRSFGHLKIDMLGRHRYEAFSSTFLREAIL